MAVDPDAGWNHIPLLAAVMQQWTLLKAIDGKVPLISIVTALLVVGIWVGSLQSRVTAVEKAQETEAANTKQQDAALARQGTTQESVLRRLGVIETRQYENQAAFSDFKEKVAEHRDEDNRRFAAITRR